jgi:hypothetical protein
MISLGLKHQESHLAAAIGAVCLAAMLSSQKRYDTWCTVSVTAKSSHFFVLK